MNHFVDFGKRSIELPTGCKDLFDVLERGNRPSVHSTAIRAGQSLSQLSRDLVNLLVQSTRPKNLVITWGSKSYVHLRNNQQVLTAIVVVHGGVLREQSVRAVFGAADLAPVSNETAGGGHTYAAILPPGHCIDSWTAHSQFALEGFRVGH